MNSAKLSLLFPWLVGAGVGLLVFSFVWPGIVGESIGYTDEDAEAYQKASVRLHSCISGHGSGGHDHTQAANKAVEVTDEELAGAQEEFNQALARRDRACNRVLMTGRVIQCLGIASAIAGVIAWAVARGKDAG